MLSTRQLDDFTVLRSIGALSRRADVWFASGTPRPTAWNVRHYAHYDHVRVCPYSTAVRMPSYSALRVRDDYPKEGNQTRAQKGPAGMYPNKSIENVLIKKIKNNKKKLK